MLMQPCRRRPNDAQRRRRRRRRWRRSLHRHHHTVSQFRHTHIHTYTQTHKPPAAPARTRVSGPCVRALRATVRCTLFSCYLVGTRTREPRPRPGTYTHTHGICACGSPHTWRTSERRAAATWVSSRARCVHRKPFGVQAHRIRAQTLRACSCVCARWNYKCICLRAPGRDQPPAAIACRRRRRTLRASLPGTQERLRERRQRDKVNPNTIAPHRRAHDGERTLRAFRTVPAAACAAQVVGWCASAPRVTLHCVVLSRAHSKFRSTLPATMNALGVRVRACGVYNKRHYARAVIYHTLQSRSPCVRAGACVRRCTSSTTTTTHVRSKLAHTKLGRARCVARTG